MLRLSGALERFVWVRVPTSRDGCKGVMESPKTDGKTLNKRTKDRRITHKRGPKWTHLYTESPTDIHPSIKRRWGGYGGILTKTQGEVILSVWTTKH